MLRLRYSNLTTPIPCMLMHWLLVWPGHQLWWHHLWGWAWSIYKFYHESICYLICYKRKSVLILTMVFNLFAPMSAIYMFVFVQFVFPVCFCCNAPCFIGLIFLQRTWMMICNENIFTCMFSPKIRKKCSNMVMLLTSVYEYGWMPNMF